jgi:hypothetical protein
VTRVEWTRTEPGDIEHVVSMLLCRENPSAVRIRPSRGDGGIDVLAPSRDGTGVVVYQVKLFTKNLTQGQKAQAERSFRRLLDYARGRGLHVREWYLTLPLCPTNENLEWLRGFRDGHGLTAEWRGLNFLDGLAATYPAVIDYYLHDGRDRLEAALESLTAVLRTSMRIGLAGAEAGGPIGSPSGPLRPAETAGTLAALHAALNEHDPHFSYDYSVDTARPEVPDQPGLVAAVQDGDGKRWVTFKVSARCAESLVERPVPLSLTITADPASDLQRDIEAFDKYGTPFTAPAGTADAEIDLPGGLGGTITGGSVRLEPAASTRTAGHDIRLQVVDPADQIIAETIVHMDPPTTGPSRRGMRGHGTEQYGVFAFEVLTDLDAQTVSYTLRPGDLTGTPPGRALAGLQVLREFRYPNGLRIAAPFGPATHRSEPIPDGTELAAGVVFDIVEALAALQGHTTVQLVISDLAKLTHGEARRILHAAELVGGAAISAPWEGFAVHLTPGASLPSEDIFSGLLYQELHMSVGATEVGLGYQQVYLPAARAEPGSMTRHGDHHDIRIVPAGGAQAVIRYSQATAPSASQQSVRDDGSKPGS